MRRHILVFIDDATSRLMELRFVPSESTFAYFDALKSYLQHHGKPVAFYSDKHSIFRVSNENAASGNGMTQFGRANLNIHDGIGGALLYVIERLFARRRAEPPRAPAAGVLCAPTPAPGIFAAMRRCFSLSVPTLVSLMDCRASQ
jgi:hypothetical protein